MKQHTKRVGIIGLGIMGSIIARALVAAGHEVANNRGQIPINFPNSFFLQGKNE